MDIAFGGASNSKFGHLQSAVQAGLTALPERLRVPLVLYYFEGRTQAELGRILGLTDRAENGKAHLRRRRLDESQRAMVAGRGETGEFAQRWRPR